MDEEKKESLFRADTRDEKSETRCSKNNLLYIVGGLLLCVAVIFFIWHSRQQMPDESAEIANMVPMVDFNAAMQEIASGDPAKGVEMVKILADSGMPQAQLVLALCSAEGRGTAKNVPAAVELARLAAEKNMAEAYLLLSSIYLGTFGNEYSDQQKAFEWCRQCFEKRIPGGTYLLAVCYMNGVGCKTDSKAAFELINAAAKENDPRAQRLLNGIVALYPKLNVKLN